MELYKLNEVNSHRFYKTPKDLFFNKCYRFNLSSDAKLLYSILLDRMELSRKNNWVNYNNEIYLLYTKENLATIMGISESTVYKSFKQLDAFKLTKQQRQGLNKPNKIFIGKVNPEFTWNCKICSTGPVKCKEQDIDILQASETVFSETYNNETDTYITLPSDAHIFLNIYKTIHKAILGREHVRVTEEQLEDILDKLNELEGDYGIDLEMFRDEALDHLENLPESNNGNIIAFLTAHRRYFG